MLAPFESPGTENPYLLTQELQAVMQEGAMIARTEEGLSKCLDQVLGLQERAKNLRVEGSRLYNPGWHTALDLPNLLTASEAVTRSALERKESRGAHFREDFPDKDPASAKFNVVVRKGADGMMRVERVPIPEMPPELRQVIEEMK